MADTSNASNSNASDTVMAWLWVIEYLASVQEIDSATWLALIDAAPQFPGDLGENTRERVALRCLEDLFGTRDGRVDEGRSAPEEKVSFDLSKSCEEVLHSILQERSLSDLSNGGEELSKWDIHPFIVHKRASMPKCALEKLKDAILEGTHPCTSTLREFNGLVRRNDMHHSVSGGSTAHHAVASRVDDSDTAVHNMASTGNLFPIPLENNPVAGDDLHDGNLLPCKRDRIELVNENIMGDYHEKDDGNDLNSEAKRLKRNGLSTEQPTDHILASGCAKKLAEDDSERMNKDNGQDDFHVETESQLGPLEESRSLDNGHSDNVVIAGIGQSPDAGDEIGHNQCETDINTDRVTEPISGGPLQQHILVDKTDEVEGRTLDGACCTRTEQDAFIDEAKKSNDLANQLKSSIVASFSGFRGKVNLEEPEGNKDHLSEDDASSDDEEYNHERVEVSDDKEYAHERVDVSLEKNQFLSSQCPWGDDSLSMSYWTEQNLCVKCHNHGQLLVCSLPGCPVVVHENCLGTPAKFDDKGDFYCPFCAYSLAISEYVEGKRKASLARKQVATSFHCSLEHSRKKHTAEVVGKKHQNLQHNRDNPLHQTNNKENFGESNETHDGRSLEKQDDATRKEIHIPIEGEAREKIVKKSLHLEVHDEQHDQVQADPMLNDDDQSCRIKENVSKRRRRRAHEFQKKTVKPQIVDSSETPICAVHIDGDTSDDQKGNSLISNYSIRVRKREKQYTDPPIPMLRRKKVPWTAKEEEMLKGGVEKFSSVDDRNIPWKKILEYGGSVFQHGGRTAIDLKDKWRNMCRGSPKVK